MIRKANLYDLEAIYSLYTAYLLDISRVHDPAYASTVQRDGFTVAPASKEKLAQRIENNVLFNIFEADEEMLGFININREIYFPEDSDKIIWFSKAFKDNYFHNEK